MENRPLGFIPFPISFRTKLRYHELGETLIPPETVLLAFRGSVAHGMFVDPEELDAIDDVDLIGITIPEKKYFLGLSQWGSRGTKEYREGIWDGVFYDIRKLFILLLQGNPNVMGLLWLRPEHYLYRTGAGETLVSARKLFVAKSVYEAFAGYARGQFEKMGCHDPLELRQYLAVTAELKYRGAHPNHKGVHFERPGDVHSGMDKDVASWETSKLLAHLNQYHKKDRRIGYMGEKRKRLVLERGYDAKNAAHCIRLLRMCVEFLNTGIMHVYRPDAGDAEELLAIKKGEWTLAEVKAEARRLFSAAEAACGRSTLPEEPDRAGAEDLLIRTVCETWVSL